MTTNYVPHIVFDTFCFTRTTQIQRACPLPRSPSNTRAGLQALRRAQQFIVFRADTTAFYSARNLNSPCVTGGRRRRRGCKTHHYRYRPPLLRLFQDSMSVSPYFVPKHTSVTQHNSRTQNALVSTCPSSYQYLIDTLTYSHSSALCLSNYSRKNSDANSKQKSSC